MHQTFLLFRKRLAVPPGFLPCCVGAACDRRGVTLYYEQMSNSKLKFDRIWEYLHYLMDLEN